jgi:hypothetical protein
MKKEMKMFSRLLAAAVLAGGLMHGTALAQSQEMTGDAQNPSVDTPATDGQTLPEEVKQKLERQGFTDVQIAVGSYVVSAKTKDGDPIMALVGPHSMLVLTVSPNSETTIGSGTENKALPLGSSGNTTEDSGQPK